eukprot:scaffold31616_cov23-Cyclotella_meneghiniana.AAC.3
MDEFDFEDVAPPSSTASSLAASSHSYSQALHDASPSRHPPSSSSSSLSPSSLSLSKQSTSSSPARGRTKARRSRKVIRTGHDAKLAAVERFGDVVDNDNVKIVSKSRGGAVVKKQLNGAKRMDTPSSRDGNDDANNNNSNNNNNSSSSSASSVRIYGRRRKKQKMSAASTPKDYDSIDTFANDDHDYKLMDNMSFNHRDDHDTPNTNNAAAEDTPSYFKSPSRPNNNNNNTTNSKSVRFSLWSNDEHYYSYYDGTGTPPSSQLNSGSTIGMGTPPEDTASNRKEENALYRNRYSNGNVGGRRIEIHSSSQSHGSVIYEGSTSEIGSVGCTMKEEDGVDTAHKEPVRKKRRECNNMNNDNNNNKSSSSPAKSSDHSASSYG